MATKDFLKCFFSQVFKSHFHSGVLILIVHVCCYYTQPIFKDVLSESNIPEKKLLSSQSDVYLWFKIVFKGLERNSQFIALGNRFLTMPQGLQERVFSIKWSTFPFFLSSDSRALIPWVHGFMLIALHFTDCKEYTYKLAFVEFSFIIKSRNNIIEEWSMILWELLSPQVRLSFERVL